MPSVTSKQVMRFTKNIIAKLSVRLLRLFDAKNKILIPEWHKEEATQERVRTEIQNLLADMLPEPTDDRLSFSEKVDVAFRHFYTLAELGLGVAA